MIPVSMPLSFTYTSIHPHSGVRTERDRRTSDMRQGERVEVEEVEQAEENDANASFVQVIRGNSVVLLEALERIGGDDRRGGGDHRG